MKRTAICAAAASILLAQGHLLAADGKAVYGKSCAACHTAMPPKLSDKAAWQPRLSQGTDAMVASVVKGKGAMPPKAGNASLSDADIRAAVEYMVAEVNK